METRSTKRHSDTPGPFSTVALRLKEWRAAGRPGRRIPERLWNLAIHLARVHGLSPTASALKLNFYDLQRRLGVDGPPPKRRLTQPVFLEVPTPAFPSPAADPGTLELMRPSGARLTLRLPNATAKELLPLVELWLRQRL